jgi:hypothetical protein
MFFAFHDDPLRPRYVERLVDALDQHPKAVLAFSDMESDERVVGYADLEGVDDPFERLRRLMFVYGHWWVPFRGLMRDTVVRELGGMQRLLFGEEHTDWIWLLRVASRGAFVRVPEPLVVKVRRAAGVEAGWKPNVRNQLATQLALVRVIADAKLPPQQAARMYGNLVKTWVHVLVKLPRDRRPF